MKLSAARVKIETKPGRLNDGNGLYLLIRPDGRKGWIFRYRLGDKQRDMGLGSYPEVSLAEARQHAMQARQRLRSGADPIQSRRGERAILAQGLADASERTFEALAKQYIARHEASWKNDKHRAQWKSSLKRYAYPKIGDLDVAAIDRAAVLKVLEPIWTRTPETASRVRGRIEIVLDYAAAKGWRDAANPARWRDLRHDLPAPKKVKPVNNQPALPWQQLPAFMVDLRARPATAARALEFTILTAARTSEVLGARWSEIDLDNATWTVPARRMKASRPHRVALSPAAIAVLQAMKPVTAKRDSLVFPGQRANAPLSTMALLMLLRRMQQQDVPVPVDGDEDADAARWCDTDGRPITPHGFRATFRTWAGDQTDFAREVIEAALAHVITDKVEAAYARGDLLDRRRPLMAAWADYMDGKAGGNVVELGRTP